MRVTDTGFSRLGFHLDVLPHEIRVHALGTARQPPRIPRFLQLVAAVLQRVPDQHLLKRLHPEIGYSKWRGQYIPVMWQLCVEATSSMRRWNLVLHARITSLTFSFIGLTVAGVIPLLL